MSHFTGKHGLEDYEGQEMGVVPYIIGGDVLPTHWPTTWAPSYDTDPPINYGEPIGPEPNWNAINEPMPGVPGIADPWMLSEPPTTTPQTPNMQYTGPMLGDLQDAIMMYENTPGGNSMPTLLTEPFTPFSPPALNRDPMWTTDVHMGGTDQATVGNTQSWFQNVGKFIN